MPILQPLILEVYNNAITTDSAPASWKDIRVRLLPKKGDLTDLRNWRPISLINCDAKILSRVINSRLNPIINNIIQCSQTGFMKGRFIGENGLLLHLLLNQARYRQYPGIGLLLDQEKAYDRVNPQYLMKVMEAFGFRRQFLTCVHNFFFGNLIEVNVNGYFTSTIFQQRGLRQGDPLSPLLFNLALEPLRLSIQQDRTIIGYGYESDGVPQSVKTIAYADDVCVILKTQDDFTRLRYHLSQYSQVSNAKFNQAKTEAFSLNGDKDVDWERYLLHHNISTYHTKYSSEPFRYLGFYMAYTINQRNFIQDTLLHKVKDQVKLYSSRHLSLRGRATVTNTLIMTKIWYALRLLHPTQAFLKKLKSIIYDYVWQNKRPLVSYSQLSLPLSHGGVGLLQPTTQHLVLQIRHLHHVFRPNNSSSLVRPLFKHHMNFITPSPLSPEMSFFVPEWRTHPLNHPTSIVNACYQAFDHFGINFDFSRCPVATLLQLPLHYLMISYPADHWLHRHKKFLASNFFTYDSGLRRLRLQVDTGYSQKPILCRKLKKEILELRTVKLHSYLFDHVIADVDEDIQLVPNITTLVSQLQHNQLWHSYTSHSFRNLKITGTISLFSPIPAKDFKTFWSLPLLLPARNHWYRVISKKLPTATYLHKIGTVASTLCRLCGSAAEDFEHFVVSCPNKNPIWSMVLKYHFPTYLFTNTDILNALHSIKSPFHHRSNLYRPFFVIVSTTQFYIWKAYWQLVIDSIPFTSDAIVTTINRQIHILLNRISD
ncbi:hypothetical protein G6F37_012049 [Rhizopus arrhizus]|nr:hypothetical protein G6F38_012145 [Rhizopus arrhizus]KAG1145982.1 hypothetical protein G6F37_012049 [Rhizopus arrhizus]